MVDLKLIENESFAHKRAHGVGDHQNKTKQNNSSGVFGWRLPSPINRYLPRFEDKEEHFNGEMA